MSREEIRREREKNERVREKEEPSGYYVIFV